MRLWTRQVPEVLGELQETGVYHVKKEYIKKKMIRLRIFI